MHMQLNSLEGFNEKYPDVEIDIFHSEKEESHLENTS